MPPSSYGYRYAYPRYAFGYYPWGFGGLGFGDYYNGFYDPWSYGGYQNFGVYPGYGGGGYASAYEGSLHLKMKPREAQVFVDGYYAGEPLVAVREASGAVSHLDLASFRFTRLPYDPERDIPGGVDDAGWH